MWRRGESHYIYLCLADLGSRASAVEAIMFWKLFGRRRVEARELTS
jgi:hypothetical protein